MGRTKKADKVWGPDDDIKSRTGLKAVDSGGPAIHRETLAQLKTCAEVSCASSALASQPEMVALTSAGVGGMIPEDGVIYLAYMSALGDAAKVASVLQIPLDHVRARAEAGGWIKRVDEFKALAAEEEGGEKILARELNRMANIIQAFRMRRVIDQCLGHITTHKVETMFCYDEYGKAPPALSQFVSLVRAAEAVHRMTYLALGDVLRQGTAKDLINTYRRNTEGQRTIYGSLEQAVTAASTPQPGMPGFMQESPTISPPAS
jgi:hypothetical protein